MENNRYTRGINHLSDVDGEAGEKVIASLETIAPDLARYIIEFAFGDIYHREGLDLKEREMVTVTSLLTTGGCEAQLEVHVNGALNVGIPAKKIIEIFIQCVPYVGFPKVLNAVSVAKKVFENRGIE